MPINLKDHAVYIDRLQMDMVPLSVAEKALQEVVESSKSISEALTMINTSLTNIDKTVNPDD